MIDTSEHFGTTHELRGLDAQIREKTWLELGLPIALPKIPEPPKLPEASSRMAAKQHIYDALGAMDSRRIFIVRNDGKYDAAFARITTPQIRGDMVLTNRFVHHLIDDHPNQKREMYANLILPSLRNPAEVWLRAHQFDERIVYRRVFIAAFENTDTVTISQEDRHGNLSWTFYTSRKIHRDRKGYLVYRRK